MEMRGVELPALGLILVGGLLWYGTVRTEITVKTEGDLNIATVTDIRSLDFVTSNPSDFPINSKSMQTDDDQVCKRYKVLSDYSCGILEQRMSSHQELMSTALNVTLTRNNNLF
jgi:hypothetical protein